MATITEYFETSLQKYCSLNVPSSGGGDGFSSSSSSQENNDVDETTLDLNSDISLPLHWEQRLDLKTGEIYYVNRRTGMKAKEDPSRRTAADFLGDGGGENNLYSFGEEDRSPYDDSKESSSESSPSSSSSCCYSCSSRDREYHGKEKTEEEDEEVLVVAGCRSCHMYFMVPKLLQDCPKCFGQLLHFDRSQTASR